MKNIRRVVVTGAVVMATGLVAANPALAYTAFDLNSKNGQLACASVTGVIDSFTENGVAKFQVSGQIKDTCEDSSSAGVEIKWVYGCDKADIVYREWNSDGYQSVEYYGDTRSKTCLSSIQIRERVKDLNGGTKDNSSPWYTIWT